MLSHPDDAIFNLLGHGDFDRLKDCVFPPSLESERLVDNCFFGSTDREGENSESSYAGYPSRPRSIPLVTAPVPNDFVGKKIGPELRTQGYILRCLLLLNPL
jgi:hypothetical protein